MPSPRKGETKKAFIARCMGDPEATASFPDQKQRAAFCYSQWDKSKTKANVMPTTQHKRSISFRAHRDESAEIRTETMLGRDYVVVPVVALVEGVLQGMNADGPELVLEEEFGRVPQGWNGRPVTMNHPTINNIPVSANSPAVLEAFAFGQLFNTRVEEGKLKTEAWIDITRANELGGEFASTLKRLQDGEKVEVSTGLFTSVEKKKGRFNGKDYVGIWRGIVPDHLALLSEGIKGACSIEDGCGAPRVNVATRSWPEFRMDNTCTCGSSCGCKQQETVMSDSQVQTQSQHDFDFSRLVANAFPDSIMDGDIRKLLQDAIRKELGGQYAYVIGFTMNSVIYEAYDLNVGSYITLQRSFDISAERVVTLQDDTRRVNLLIEIVPADGSSSGQSRTNQETSTMSNDTKGNLDPKTAADPKVNSDPEAPSVDAKPKGKDKMEDKQPAGYAANASGDQPQTPAKPRTLQEYLAEAPAEIRESLESGLRLHREKKDELIRGLKATNRCKFSDEQLKAMSLEQLENLAELAAVPTFEGRATPKANAADDDRAPPPPIAFPMKAQSAA